MVDVANPLALSWKHKDAPGIVTVAGVLTEWPASLGPMPTQAQVNQWEAEYAAFVADKGNEPTELDELVRALKGKGTLTDADIDAAKRARL